MKRILSIFCCCLFTGFVSHAGGAPSGKLEYYCDNDPALKKLGGSLLKINKRIREGKSSPVSAARSFEKQAVRGDRIQCVIGATGISKSLVRACEDAGLEIVCINDRPNLHQITVLCPDPRVLETLARRPDVLGIIPEPVWVSNAGSVSNQVDVSINADDARSAYSVDGTGIRIGVLSDSVSDTIGGSIVGGILTGSGPQTSGDLPAQIRVVDAGPGGGSDEGAGMMELIYDLAPGCDLSFASAASGYVNFASNITALASDPGFECDILVDDVLYYIEPVYQDGPISQAVDTVFSSGVAYYSSAGNNGSDAHEQDYVDTDSGADETGILPTGIDLHDFGLASGSSSDTHLEINLAPQGAVTVVLHWDEPYGGVAASGPGAETDLDLYLVSNTNLPLQDPDPTPGSIGPGDNVLVSSNSFQGSVGSPAGTPYEFIRYENPSAIQGQTVYVVIDHYDGREPVRLHLLIVDDGVTSMENAYLGDRTLYGHSAAAGAVAVAAIFYGEVDSGGSVTPPAGILNLESFSALGGDLPFYFPASGSPRFGSPVNRFKPEVTAPDGGNTTFFGGDIGFDSDSDPNFFGTSAAAPHAAAVAALVKQANPSLTPIQINDILRSTTIDVGATGRDPYGGDGLIDAFRAVGQALPPPNSAVRMWNLYR